MKNKSNTKNEIDINIENGIRMQMAIVNMNDAVLWEGSGTWCKKWYDEMKDKLQLGYEFEEWAEEQYKGEDWSMYGCDGMGILMMGECAEGESAWLEYLDQSRPGWDGYDR